MAATLSIVGSAAPASASAHLIQPSGESFAAAFPGTPLFDINTIDAHARFPGASGAAFYWVSPAAGKPVVNPAKPAPPAPTFLVERGSYPTPAAAAAFTARLVRTLHLTPGMVDGLHGHVFLGREARFVTKRSSATQPKAYASVAEARRGNVIVVAVAFSLRRHAAVAFTRSLRVVAPGASALPTSSGTVPGIVPTAAASTSSHKVRDGAIIVVGLALIALGIAFKRQGSFSLGHTKRTPAPDGQASPAAQAPSEAAAEVVETAPPPVVPAEAMAMAGVAAAPADASPLSAESPEPATAVATTSSRTVLPLPPPPPAPAAPAVVEPSYGGPVAAPTPEPELPSPPAAPIATPLRDYIGTPDILPGR